MATIEEQVMRAKTPREAVLILARALDTLRSALADLDDKLTQPSDGWDVPFNVEDEPLIDLGPPDMPAFEEVEPTQQGVENEIVLPIPDDEKRARRALFAEQSLQLSEYAETENEWPDRPEPPYDSWEQVYADAGPFWLYTLAREFCMGLPRAVRMEMVSDIEQDNPQVAREVARDLLKYGAADTEL